MRAMTLVKTAILEAGILLVWMSLRRDLGVAVRSSYEVREMRTCKNFSSELKRTKGIAKQCF